MNLFKKVFARLKTMPKRASAVAIVAAAIIVPSIAMAWGPSRTTYTVANPAPKVTFNSITDNPVVGDERNFVTAKDITNTTDGGWQDNVTVQPGHEYIIRIYAHNDAATNLNLKAVNTRVSASVPTTTGTAVTVSGFITADNADPKQVWDDVSFNSTQQFNLAYVAGSARIYNNGYAAGGNGQPLPDNIVTSTGDLIGYNGPDGIVPGCFQYANYIYMTVKPQFATPTTSFTVTKDVRKAGTSTFVNSVASNPGDTLNYRINYTNTGTSTTSGVILNDVLPQGETYVPGSVQILNANNPNGAPVANGDKLFTTSGINIGSYTPGSNALIVYNATVASNASLPVCGPNTLTNTASATVGYTTVNGTASTTVNKTCTTPVTPTYACSALTASFVSGTTYTFNGSATASNGATIVGYSVDFGDGVKSPVTQSATNISHTYATSATGASYTATLNVTVNVNNANKTVTSASCTVTIKVGSTPECKPGIPVGDSRCVTTTTPPTTTPPTTTPPTTTPPTTTPTKMPHTGAGMDIASFLGIGALVTSIGYYVNSRRAIFGR